MPIPDDPAFESFLSNCEVVPEKPALNGVRLVDTFPDPINGPKYELFLRYPDGGIQIESVLKVLSKDLAGQGAASGSRIALSTLALVTESREASKTMVEHANSCLARTQPGTLLHAFVLPSRPRPGYRWDIGKVSLREFDPERILYWAGRAQAGYPVDLKQFRGQGCFYRSIDTDLIDWQEVPGLVELAKRRGLEWTKHLVDAYYYSIFQHYSDDLPRQVKAELLVLEAGGLTNVDERMFTAPFCHNIGLFTWRAPQLRGWALLSSKSGIHANSVPSEVVDTCTRWLETEFGYRGLSAEKPFDRSIETYCRFLQLAHAKRLDRKVDEAFLYFAIALDLLLGSEGQLASSVASRSAVLVHQQLESSLTDQTSKVKRIYNSRSKYVHEGRGVDPRALDEIEEVCTHTLWCVLAASSAGSITQIEDWLKRIDAINASLLAGIDVDEKHFLAIGLPPAGHPRKAPNRVLGLSVRDLLELTP